MTIDLATVRNQLDIERTGLERELRRFSVSERPIELQSRAAARSQQGDGNDLQIELRQGALAVVVAALGRLDAGTYGSCVSCGRPIEPQRLECDISTALCAACAARRE